MQFSFKDIKENLREQVKISCFYAKKEILFHHNKVFELKILMSAIYFKIDQKILWMDRGIDG